jgi:hypothetical protein
LVKEKKEHATDGKRAVCKGNICVDPDTGEVLVEIDRGSKDNCPPQVVEAVLRSLSQDRDVTFKIGRPRYEVLEDDDPGKGKGKGKK